ncbi:MAG: glycosyltransferase [Betaproteobacteria bacterium]|nr:glycosyltransferase [Betaproteobacteria bacterium]
MPDANAEHHAPHTGSGAVATTKVLHLINGENYSGAERVQDLLAESLGEFGYHVDFVCLRPGVFAERRTARDATVHEWPMKSRFDLSVADRVTTLVREGGYEVIHTHTPRAALVGGRVAKNTGLPLVHHLHSPTARDTESRMRNVLNASAEWMVMRRAAQIICVSGSLVRYLDTQRIRGSAVSVVHNGVPTPGDLSPWKQPASEWVLGTVALFRPRKGLEVLLHAMKRLKDAGSRVRLRAVGEFETTEYRDTIMRIVAQLGIGDQIDFVGFTKDVAGELARMDVFVFPSLFGEGLPMAMLEAMAAGVLVVATAVEGIPEALRSGQDGVVVAPGDDAALARALSQLLGGSFSIERMRRSAYERQRDQFSNVSMARGVSRAYDRALGRDRSSGTTR